jgi:hypothetical protein
MAIKRNVPVSQGYHYETARDLLGTVLDDFAILAGDQVGPSGASWQDVAGTCAVNLRALATALDAARAGRVVDGPVVFPSPSDLTG